MGTLKDEWKAWINIIKDLQPLELSRPYSTSDYVNTQLHVFCDSSTKAYGAVAYLRHSGSTILLMAKSRVASIKAVTLPRLELLPILLGANLTNYIAQILEPIINGFQIYLWSDSQIVLSWLNSKKKLPQFIAARVMKINKLTKKHTWGYCPSSPKPADLITKGMNGNTLIAKSTYWLQGPQWLSDEEKWPKKETLQQPTRETSELYIQHQEVKEDPKQEHDLLKSLGLEKHSNFNTLIRVLAFVLWFIDKCRKRHSPSPR